MINFEATLKALSERGVNFVVIGGYAATLHGSAYLTRDLDICYERTPENMERLVSALSPYHPRLRGADRSAIVPAPVQRRQQLCST